MHFNQVIGLKSEIKELMLLIEILKAPDKFAKFGATLPKGILIYGPSGTGKTMLVRTLVDSIRIPFYPVTADKIMFEDDKNRLERLKDVFKLANDNNPSIVFIDEIDSFLDIDDHSRDNKSINQLLTLMDGYYQSNRIIVMATTSHVDALPRALLRPGRFDKLIELSNPNLATRKEAIQRYTKYISLSEDLSIHRLASAMNQKTLPEIKHIVNETILSSVKSNQTSISEDDFYKIMEKVELGLKPEDDYISDSLKKRVAIHEVGHALISYTLDNSTKLLRVSISPNGHTMGHVRRYTETDHHFIKTKKELTNEIKIILAGIAAESVLLGEFSSGGSTDIEKASEIANRMVGSFGMSSIGPVYMNSDTYFRFGSVSEAFQERVDNAMSEILNTAFKETTQYFEKHKPLVEHIVNILLNRHLLLEDEFRAIVEDFNNK